MRQVRLLSAALIAAALIAGCGDDFEEGPAPEPGPAETADSVPDLPSGWEVHANRAGGFAFGLPPGWEAKNHGTITEVRSFDGLVVLTIAADRTDEAIEIDPAESATRTLSSVDAFDEPVTPGEPRPFEHRYEAYEVTAHGRNRQNGVEQGLSLIVLRRDRSAIITVLIAANADERAKPARKVAGRVVQTLRTQPPSAGGR